MHLHGGDRHELHGVQLPSGHISPLYRDAGTLWIYLQSDTNTGKTKAYKWASNDPSWFMQLAPYKARGHKVRI